MATPTDSKTPPPFETEFATPEQLAELLRGKIITGDARVAMLSLWRKRQRAIQQPAIVVDCIGDAFPDEATRIFAPGADESLAMSIFATAETPERQKLLATQLLLLADYRKDTLPSSPELLILQQLISDHWTATEPVTSLSAVIQVLASNDNFIVGVLPADSMLPSEQRQLLAMRLNALLIEGSIEKWGQGPLLIDAINNASQTIYISLSTLPQHEQNWALHCISQQLSGDSEAVLYNIGTIQQLATTQPGRSTEFLGLIGLVEASTANGKATTTPTKVIHSRITQPTTEGTNPTIELHSDSHTTVLYSGERQPNITIESLEDLQRHSLPSADGEPWVDIAYFPVADTDGENLTDLHYRSGLLIEATFTYLLPRLGKKLTKTEVLLAMLMPSGMQVDEHSTVQCSTGWPEDLQRLPLAGTPALTPPPIITRHDRLARSQSRMISTFAKQQKIPLYHCAELGLTSEPNEASEDFESRLRQLAAVRNEDRTSAIRAKFEPKLRHIDLRIRKSDSQYRKALKKLEGGNVLLRPAKYLTSKALSSPLNPGMHLPLRRASQNNKLQSELTQSEQRLERLKRQQRDLQGQYQQALDKQKRQHKNEELEYRRFFMKTNASSAEIQRCLLTACPWAEQEDDKGEKRPLPVYSI